MEVFDYSHNVKDTLSIDADSLNSKEVRRVNHAIAIIKEESKEAREKSSLEWFHVAILPILQDFADMTASVLQLEADNKTIVVATIKNPLGLDITQSCNCMKMLFSLANHIGINIDDGQASLSFIFDCSDYVG